MKAHLVTATEIAQWANTLESRALLPKLIRKLALASKISFKEIRFAADEGIQEPDWDGYLDSPLRTTFIPKGRSGWEVSSKKTVRSKADDDIAIRAKSVPVKERNGITYICVTTRRWADKKSWVKAHNAKGKKRWRNVIAYDATDLETWLESAPVSVHVWLSEVLGKRPQEVMSIDAAWSAWANVSKRPSTPKLIKAGRTPLVEQLIAQLNGSPSVIMIKGETREEVQAFVLASILGMPEPAKESVAVRTLIVNSRTAWDLYSLNPSSLVLIAMFDDRSGIEQAARAGHTVIIPMDRSDPNEDAAMQLPPISRSEAAEALKEMGCKSGDLRTLAFTGHRSLMSLRRQLAEVRSVYEPRWAKTTATDALVPALLAGSWSEETDRNEADRNVMETLSGQSYDSLRAELLKWANEPDAPIRLVGKSWYVVSQEDLWARLSKHITAEHLRLFGQVAWDVLKRPLPSLDLPPQERLYAPVRGLHPYVSSDLRRGLVESLAFMGARGGGVTLADGTTLEHAPVRIIHDLLTAANTDWRIWASLSNHLPAFAEAAPDIFMKGVDDGLKLLPSPLAPLFADEEDWMFGRTYYSGLLSALQTLAWKSEYLARVSDLLACLMALDPTKKQTNRPLDSLYLIMQPWVQNCNSSVGDRLRVIEGLRKRQPAQAYDLLVQIMPSHSKVALFYTSIPRWRDWPVAEHRNVRQGEDVNAILESVSAWLIEDTANDPERCVQLCGCFDQASRPFFERAMKHLNDVDLSNWSGEQRMAVWDKLRDRHTHHTTYRKQPSSMPKDLLGLLGTQMKRYEPLDTQLRYRWLFGGNHSLPAGSADAYLEVQTRLTTEGAAAILKQRGVEGIQSMVAVVDNSGLLGDACGRTHLNKSVEFSLLGWSMGLADPKIGWFGSALVISLYRKKGWDWVDDVTGDRQWTQWSNEKKVAFFASLPFERATWNRVASVGADIESAYWKTCMPHGSMDADQALYAAQKFLDGGKPLRALTAALRHGRRESCNAPTELLMHALEACVHSYTDEQTEVWMPYYTITEAHKMLSARTDADRQRIALIEWQFFGLLEREELVLYAEMAKDPAPFADILSFLHRPAQDPERAPTEQEAHLASRAYDVLKGWKSMPALNDDGTVSEEGLETWYRKAVAAVAVKGRMWSDYTFGEKLRYAPADSDGTWPCMAVRSLIEKLKSDDLESGIDVEVHNSRGVFSPDGGRSERLLSQRYEGFAKAVELSHPRTAAMLRRIAADYQRHALSEALQHETEQAVDYHMG